MKIAVLGAGMVGRTIADDLSKDHKVTSFDISKDNLDLLNADVDRQQADLGDIDMYASWLQPFELVVCAVPGFMGYRSLEAIINSGKNVVDISFFPENALELHELAVQKNVTAIVDCGVAPGMSNLVLGRYNEEMKVENFECMVGGLPKKRVKPFEYKAPFSPIDVIEEYTRPARYVENGHIVTKPALSDAELINFEHAGTLESFNTDGLRSIIFTMSHIPNMKEKTLRYPGHIDLIRSLRDAGFFETEKIDIKGQQVSPLDMTTKILFGQWKLQPREEEFTIMKIVVSGEQDGKKRSIEYFLYDEADPTTGFSSMSRTTGYTCTAAVNLIAEGLFDKKGVFPPELVGSDKKCFDFIISYLEKRKVIYRKTETK